VLDSPPVAEGESAERCDIEELPALLVKNVLPEQEQVFPEERMMLQSSLRQFEIAESTTADADPASLTADSYQEENHSPAFGGFAAELPTGLASAEENDGSSRHFAAVEISAFQVAVFAALFLSATFAFTVGLTVGRGPLASRLREAPKVIFAADAKPPT